MTKWTVEVVGTKTLGGEHYYSVTMLISWESSQKETNDAWYREMDERIGTIAADLDMNLVRTNRFPIVG